MNDVVERGLSTHLNRFDAATLGATARLGWKVAFNVRPVQERLGISGSLIAGLTRATLHDGALPYSLAGAARPALEAEVAVWLGRNIAAGDPEQQVAAAIAAWAPAIELVDFDRPFDELEAILAEGVFHRAVVLGARTQVPAGADLAGYHVHVEHGGRVVCDVDAREATGHAPAVLSHLAQLLAPYGHILAAGDVVILGSMNPLTLAEAGKTFAVSMDGLGATSLSLTA